MTQLVSALALEADVNPKEKDYGTQLVQLVEWAYITKLIVKDKDGAYRLGAFNGVAVDTPVSTPPKPEQRAPEPTSKIEGKDAILEALSRTFGLKNCCN